MPPEFGLTTTQSCDLETLIARAEALFSELVGSAGARFVVRFEGHRDDDQGTSDDPVGRSALTGVRVGLGQPGFFLWLERGYVPEEEVAKIRDQLPPGAPPLRMGTVLVSGSDFVDDDGVSLSFGPNNRTATSFLIAACALIAAAELTDGQIDVNGDYLVEGAAPSPRLALAALRGSLTTAGDEEELSRQRLARLPGVRDWEAFQTPGF